jgi:hypothetical protein
MFAAPLLTLYELNSDDILESLPSGHGQQLILFESLTKGSPECSASPELPFSFYGISFLAFLPGNLNSMQAPRGGLSPETLHCSSAHLQPAPPYGFVSKHTITSTIQEGYHDRLKQEYSFYHY